MRIYLIRGILLIVTISIVWTFLYDSSSFQVKEVTVSVSLADSDKLVWADLNHKISLELNQYKNSYLWEISLRQIRKKLTRFPEVKDLKIQKKWPHTLIVEYKLPSLEVIQSTGSATFKILTGEGHWIGPLEWRVLPILPWIRGDWISKNTVQLHHLLKLLSEIPLEGSFSKRQISEIQFTESDGFLFTLAKSGQQIQFGHENFELKSVRVAQVLDYLQSRGLESRVIDANFSKKVLVRLRNHP